MEKTVIGLVAALGAAAPLAAAQAAVVTPEDATSALRVSSVAELLDPAPNAVAVLAALDESGNSPATGETKGVQVAQYHHHHHHHHHHHWRWHHHHHHYWRHHHHWY